jgi:nitrate reductase NapE component
MCVKLFLPALLIFKLGSQLELETGMRYVPILIWAIGYNLLSIAIGVIATRFFSLPGWTTPALAFNNTTSLPLLLIQSLSATGILESVLRDGDTADAAVDRAVSYFLVNALVSNSLTFALGPRLLGSAGEDGGSDENEDGEDNQADGEQTDGADERSRPDEDHIIDEETTLLPHHHVVKVNWAGYQGYQHGHHYWKRLPPWAQSTLDIAYQFLNAPLIGAIIGAIIGLTPALHKLFFNKFNNGGYMNAWLTSSIQNIGDLFASLQIIVVGVKLSQSLRKMKRGEESGAFSWRSFIFITLVRFLIWPAISISIIYALATKTGLLSSDPMLWFAMMLMPTGPPAMILTALSDVSGSPETEKMAIAKFLTASYAITPLICFAVVGALKASQAALG